MRRPMSDRPWPDRACSAAVTGILGGAYLAGEVARTGWSALRTARMAVYAARNVRLRRYR